MNTIAVSTLRSNLLKILKKIEAGSEITITSRGRAVARLVPTQKVMQKSRGDLAILRQNAVVKDVISPVSADWDALK